MKFCPLFLAVGLGWGVACGCPAAAQTSKAPSAVVLPPSPPPVKPPVDFFRELLALTPAQRESALTNRPPVLQRQILAKLGEYDALSPNQRELRLKVTELRWYLWPLMNTPATNRTAQVEHLPEEMRRLVLERLVQWDKLPTAVQNDIRDQEGTIRYFTEMEGATQVQRDTKLESLSPAGRQELETRIAQWRALPEAQRQRALEHFDRFFGLNPQEKARTLSSLSEPERRKIETIIHSFGKLSPGERARCIRGLDRFTGMSVEERLKFLRNAEQWKAMSPDQRDAWTRLVSKYSIRPPLPPGLGTPPLPPMPRPPAASLVATNALGQ